MLVALSALWPPGARAKQRAFFRASDVTKHGCAAGAVPLKRAQSKIVGSRTTVHVYPCTVLLLIF